MTTNIIDKPLTRFRTAPAKGAKPKVDREGGRYGAGLIVGASAIAMGEALGHYAWVDSFAVDSVVEFGNRSPKGVKVRFTHPGLSADGMGKMLGRMTNFKREGDKAIGDIHLSRTSRKTPDGDLGAYVMDLADEDPEAFGMSIVFDHDYGAEDRFEAEHEDEDGYFRSPDDGNTSNYRHIRLSKLWASDVVDEPAANPEGLFRSGQEIAAEADRLCEFALGLSSERPQLQHLSVDADRLAQYAARFLASHNLELKEKETMSDKTETAPANGITLEQLNAFGATLLGKMDEKITAALAESKQPPKLTEAQIERKRCCDLFATAKAAGLNDYDKVAQEAIDSGATVETFKASITDRLIGQNKLTSDSGEPSSDPADKYKKEYAANRDAFSSMGLSEAEYISSRKIDDGAEMLAPQMSAA